MSKIEAIIAQFSAQIVPETMPQIGPVFQSDPDRVKQALQQRIKPQKYYVWMRVLLYLVRQRLAPNNFKHFIEPLLEISLNNLDDNLRVQARLYICEGLIQGEDLYRSAIIDKHLEDMSKWNKTTSQTARVQAVSAGNNFLKGEYTKAAAQYLNASRMEYFIRNQSKRTWLLQRAFCFAFVSPLSPESHKTICGLCLNEYFRKNRLYDIIVKMYAGDIISVQEVLRVEKVLPIVLVQKDKEGMSVLSQAAFLRNMTAIINSFSTIKLSTLSKLVGVGNINELLLLLERSYTNGDVQIDQINDSVLINYKQDAGENIKDILNQIDVLLEGQ